MDDGVWRFLCEREKRNALKKLFKTGCRCVFLEIQIMPPPLWKQNIDMFEIIVG